MGEQRNRLRPWRPPQQSEHRRSVFFSLPFGGRRGSVTEGRESHLPNTAAAARAPPRRVADQRRGPERRQQPRRNHQRQTGCGPRVFQLQSERQDILFARGNGLGKISGLASFHRVSRLAICYTTTMFVRFRETATSLQATLIETHRVDGKVRHEHVASLGSIPWPAKTADRITFWQKLHERFAKLSNRLTDDQRAAVMGAIHARIPITAAEDQHAVQLDNAKAEASFWDSLAEMH